MSDRPVRARTSDVAFERAHGEPLHRVLDLSTWQPGEDLPTLYMHLAQQVESAVRQEERVREPIRRLLFARLKQRELAPPGAGVYRVPEAELERIHRGLLFTGAVEACSGAQFSHETLPLTMTQLGVSLVSYNGQQGSWVTRLFRRDLREAHDDPVEEAMELLERRSAGARDGQEAMSILARRAILAYAERATLLHRSTAMWRVGLGSPAPYELLTGSAGSLDVMIEATRLLEELLLEHRKFIFSPPGALDRALQMIGSALEPLEYAIVQTLQERIWDTIESGEYYLPTMSDTSIRGVRLSPERWMLRFRDEVAPHVAVGVYRASEVTQPRMFYCHVDHAHEAAAIVLADSILQVQRGFPMLLDLARSACVAAFGHDSLTGPVQLAYSRAGAPLRYLTDRGGRGA